jgi:hypothetical protein
VLGIGIGVVVGVGIGVGVDVVGFVPPGSGFLGSGTGIGSGDSIGVGIGVVVGIGVGEGALTGEVKPGIVVLCEIELGAATDRELIEIMAIIGTKNKSAVVKIR